MADADVWNIERCSENWKALLSFSCRKLSLFFWTVLLSKLPLPQFSFPPFFWFSLSRCNFDFRMPSKPCLSHYVHVIADNSLIRSGCNVTIQIVWSGVNYLMVQIPKSCQTSGTVRRIQILEWDRVVFLRRRKRKWSNRMSRLKRNACE